MVQWQDVPPAVVPEIERLGLQRSVADLKEHGYAVITDVASAETIVALRDAVADGWQARPRAVTALLGTDPIYTSAVTNQKVIPKNNPWIFNRKREKTVEISPIASIFLLNSQELWGDQVCAMAEAALSVTPRFPPQPDSQQVRV